MNKNISMPAGTRDANANKLVLQNIDNILQRSLSASSGDFPVSTSAEPWDGISTSIELRQERSRCVDSLKEINGKAERENRNLFADELQQYGAMEQRFTNLTRAISEAETSEQRGAITARSMNNAGIPSGDTPVGGGHQRNQTRDNGPARLKPTESLAEVYRSRGTFNKADSALSFDGFVRGMAGKGWSGYEAEKRAFAGISQPDGGILLPEELSTSIIDLARSKSLVTQAGAQTVPMDTREVTVPRLESDMAVEWKAELEKQDDSSNTFGSIKLKARTVRAFALLSEEIIEDVESLEGFVSQAVAQAIAAEIDRVALFGSSATNAEEPTGLFNTPGVTILAAPATGTPGWADLVRSQTIIRNANHEPTATITNPLVEEFLALQADTLGQFIRPPASLDNLPMLTTSKVATTEDKSHIVMGDFGRLIIGWRSQITVKLSEGFAFDRNAIALKVTARVDIGVERANAFHIRQVNTVAE
ncbi:phage major capsid protein [Arthrobacter sp. MYb227]|uniref:phage major capsid protein n=1 Tax=Arthrobacter sp. MYb227 TaxID=1848601 RepID=UPI000CFAB85E|nr:phage major capsid protein [Arthrobacter sp. MYb227]PQZ91686.1 phage major capsid protein [Arthrobacter sp. MYb227]